MDLLESAMAFAVVMMIFSTVVSGIVETILRFLATREKTLQQAIQALFKNVIWPRLGETLDRIGTRLEPSPPPKRNAITKGASAEELHRDQFVSDMTRNLVFAEDERRVTGFLSNLNKPAIDTLTVLSFAERLGKSTVGKAIVAEGEAQVDLLVQDLARTYDRFCRAASEVFRKKAEYTAIWVSVVLALGANIDASRLLTQLIQNPEVQTRLIGQADEAHIENEAAVARLDALRKSLAELPPDDAPAHLQAQLNDVDHDVRSTIGELNETGLAIGWKYFPYCGDAASDPACQEPRTWQSTVMSFNFVSWFLMTILAGVLIGLGGPFWFKVFTGLSQVFEVLRTLGAAKSAETNEAKPDKIPAAEESAKPKDVLDAFKVAVAVNMKSAVIPRGRVLLGPTGHPL